MAGDNINFPLPLVESGQVYAPGAFAYEVQNLQLTPEGTLRGVRGPAPLIPDFGAGFPWPGRIHGVHNALLDQHAAADANLAHGVDIPLDEIGHVLGELDVARLFDVALEQQP